MSASDWMELQEWVSIRGPVGAARMNYYVAFLARYAGRQWPDKVTVADLLGTLLREMPDVKRAPVDDE